MKYLSLVALALVSFPLFAFAHETGLSFEKTVGDYLVDIGYSQAPQAGDTVSFDFDLKKQNQDTSFDDVWVQIEDPTGATALATGVHRAEYGGARLLYQFEKPGTYPIHVRYESGNTVFAETVFPLTVGAVRTHASDMPWYVWLSFGGVLGAVVGWGALRFLPRR